MNNRDNEDVIFLTVHWGAMFFVSIFYNWLVLVLCWVLGDVQCFFLELVGGQVRRVSVLCLLQFCVLSIVLI